jgi:carboxylesterase type B
MDAVVQTRAGSVRGTVADGIFAFKGVPYAAPPVGSARFRPPQAVQPWTGVRDAQNFGAKPPQPIAPPEIAAMAPDPASISADCLNLNIWTRAPGGASMPVMVWIPGGMFEVCSGASYDGSRFARDGVVCVTINYRVGAEGSLFADGVPANLGLRDQVAALAWVRDNIAAFGGDPANVTIFGESAGAMSIGALLAMPAAEGLFRRAILESGAAHTVMPVATARKVARHLAAKLDVAATREGFAGIGSDRLIAAQTELKADIDAAPDPARWGDEVVATMMPFHPVVDGEVLPARPIDRVAAGASAAVDVLVGSNADDWRLFVFANGLMGVGEDVLTGPVAKHGYRALAAYGLSPEEAWAAYRARYPGAGAADILAYVQTDWWCRMPAIALGEAHANGRAGTYMYEFAWRSPAGGGLIGACHALEIPFVFDTLDKGPAQMLGPMLGAAPPQALADAMHKAWVAFARTGDPGWPRYDLRRRATMRFDTAWAVVDDPRPWERQFWTGRR